MLSYPPPLPGNLIWAGWLAQYGNFQNFLKWPKNRSRERRKTARCLGDSLLAKLWWHLHLSEVEVSRNVSPLFKLSFWGCLGDNLLLWRSSNDLIWKSIHMHNTFNWRSVRMPLLSKVHSALSTRWSSEWKVPKDQGQKVNMCFFTLVQTAYHLD